ncbi:ABC transporter ATP-binding protein [Streptomyces demainii]|uniref:ABC-type multidrug transport system fused ATPase/permease subunit n=1 Tax=Streptomyces demainii TaxID=588122 RepID=A0ABT9L730_9ACTN|nr:ABC transporter ATP-binding protein [Streptomyces demainii]MDP9616459.1 ABC-type multidrug transport system fused ATPase/permease subunit [Streptomyces demainii]
MKQHIRLLKTYLKPQRKRVVLLVLLLFGSIALDLLAPRQLSLFIDGAEAGASLDALVTVAVVFIVLTIAKQLVVAVAGYFSEDVGWRATNALRADLADHCLNLDISFHKDHTPGELMERVDGDVGVLSDFMSLFVFSVLGRALLAVGILGLVFSTDYRIGLLLLAYSLFVVLVLRRLQSVGVPHFNALRRTKADLSGFLEERLTSTEDIRANGARPYVMHRLSEHVENLVRRTRASMISARVFSSVLEISLAAATGGVFALGAWLLPGGSISLGEIFLIYYYTQLLSLSLIVITHHLDTLQKATGAIQRISELYHTTPQVRDGEGGSLPDGALDVTFDAVSFGYGEASRTLDEVSFALPAGETVGLLGRTGSGKTTLTRLLCRAYDVDAGAVRLADVDVRDLRLADLRDRIGVVTQDVQLFHASLRDNVTLFDATIDDGHIERAFAELGLSDWYASQPDGLDTVMVNGGETLSAGEAQLLALTRVMLRDPDIIVLDEASSRLDPGTERLIARATERLLKGRTGIVVAHRLATVRKVDHIVVLDDGEVCEAGPRERLEADPASRFSALIAGGTA